MNNPFSALISKTNNVFLSYRRLYAKKPNLKRPLGFEIGYFSYRYLYDELEKTMTVDFSDIIPKNVNDNLKVDYLEFKIKLPKSSSYIMPVIRDCFTNVHTGSVNIRSNHRLTPFKMQCGNETFTLMSSMEQELTFEFRDVILSELRDRAIRFRVDYEVLPKLLTRLSGEFETNNFTHHFVSLMRETIEYEWVIELSSNYFIKLNINKLINEKNIIEFSIVDENKKLQLYDQSELIENYKQSTKYSYLFSTNKIRIIFRYLKDSKTKMSNYPYVKCFYEAEPRILNIQQTKRTGELSVSDIFTKNKLEWVIMGPKDY
jgi:hypothetical protein